MAKKIILTVLVGFAFLVVDAQKSITLEGIWKDYTFSTKGVYGYEPLNDGKSYSRKLTHNDNSYVLRYNYQDGKVLDTLINSEKIKSVNQLKTFQFDDYTFNFNEKQVLLTMNTEGIYRHSTAANVYVLDLNSHKLSLLSEQKIMYCQFDPQGKYVSYVWDNNLYIKDLKSNKVKAITSDGKRNAIINGAVDWVYEEEFSMSTGYTWNKSGTAIAYYRFDESNVREFSMTMYKDLYPKNYDFKYPKAGEANSVVDVYVYSLKSKKSKRMETGSENDQYLPRIQWTEDDNTLSIQRLNRLQNKWEILLANATNGKTEVVYQETDKYYIDITDDLMYLPGGELAVMTSERNGYKHIYLHKANGPEINPITTGKFDVDQILGYNPKTKKLYFTSFETAYSEKHVYTINLDGTLQRDLTQEQGMHSAKFSKDFSYFLHTNSTINQPPVISIRNEDGLLVRVLEDNKKLANAIKEYNFSPAKFDILTVNGTDLNYYMIKPNNFDTAKKYPLLMFVYGGPGSQQVLNSWLGYNFIWHQMLANEKGYIIACVDNRGTGARGSEFKKMTYKQLGKYESDDQIEAAKYFGKLSYIDEKRIGIWGWSYGGFMSSTCITKGADVFKAAIAVAPVTNWRYYDNIYTERYMQLPKDNADGYDQNSPINMVELLKGNYLLVHGTGDDNVHFQNSVMMVDKLVELNKPFQSAYYPNRSHGISGGNTRLHLFTLMTNFILENL